MYARTAALFVGLTMAAAGCGGGDSAPVVPATLLRDAGPGTSLLVKARVAYVIDGDTVDVQIGPDRVRVRLLGIDTPETVKRDAAVECYGPEASQRSKQLMPKGSWAWVETDVGGDRRDAFGRLLAYVTPAGSRRTVNATLLREGLADLFVFHADAPFFRADAFRAMRDEARRERRGMWGACPNPAQR